MTLNDLEMMQGKVNGVRDLLKGLSPDGFMVCMGMVFDEYCAISGANPVELAKTVADLVEQVNEAEGRYNPYKEAQA